MQEKRSIFTTCRQRCQTVGRKSRRITNSTRTVRIDCERTTTRTERFTKTSRRYKRIDYEIRRNEGTSRKGYTRVFFVRCKNVKSRNRKK